jgi:hypothetical protein
MRIKYKNMIPKIRSVARLCGYAIAFHGSAKRDLDLVAIPWVQHALPHSALAAHISQAINGLLIIQEGNPELKPHGRIGYVIHLKGRFDHTRGSDYASPGYIDLSIMPRVEPTQEDK